MSLAQKVVSSGGQQQLIFSSQLCASIDKDKLKDYSYLMDNRCEFCGKITGSPAGLKRHITIKHRQQVVIDVEALRNSILALIDTLDKSLAGIWKAMNTQREASFKRDNQILEVLKEISRDSTKHDQDILEIIDGLQAKQSKKVKLAKV